MVQRCDTSTFEIGIFSFEEHPREVKNLYVFANYEADSICIDLLSNQIILITYDVLYEFEMDDGYLDELEENYITKVAISQTAFLNALKMMTELYSFWLSDYFDNEEKEKNMITEYTEKCVALAGGHEYHWFWMDFTGLL